MVFFSLFISFAEEIEADIFILAIAISLIDTLSLNSDSNYNSATGLFKNFNRPNVAMLLSLLLVKANPKFADLDFAHSLTQILTWHLWSK